MHFLKSFFGFLLISLTLLVGNVQAESTLDLIQKKGELRVGFDSGYIPFEMSSKKGKFIGFDIDIAKAMAKAMKVKFVPVNTDFDGIIPALLTKKIDIIISGITITQERNLQINFAGPYFYSGQAILLAKKHENKVKSYKNLNHSNFLVVSRLGTTGEMATKRLIPKAKYKSFDKEADAALEVINGRADAFIYDLPVLIQLKKKMGGDKVLLLDKPFTYEPLGFGIRRGDPDFLNWLDNFIIQIKNDGTYTRMYNKWFKSDAWYKDVQ